MFPLFMSGAGTASGVDYQGHAFAYAASHILSGQFLPWFQEADDIPVSIRMERRGPGDDLRITMRDGHVIEVQAKHNAKGNDDFFASAARLIDGLLADPDLRGVLLVNMGLTTTTVRVEFEEDRVRYIDGDPFEPRRVMEQVLAKLKRPFDRAVMKRLRLIVLDLEEGSMGEDSAQKLLSPLFTDPSNVLHAWTLLGSKGVRAMARKRHYDRDALIELLARFQPRVSSRQEHLDEYLDWAVETNATFVLASLPDVCVDSFEAWDELTAPAQIETASVSDADAIRDYHTWEERRDRISVTDTYDARQLLEAKHSVAIVGGAGSGKSTLTHRLTREACEGGFVAMRVSLRQVGLALRSGRSIDAALAESAFGGSGIADDAASRLLARADYLIADGLDESDRVEVAKQLMAWRAGHSAVALIITTRPVGHSSALLPGIPVNELMALHAGGTRDVARAIFHAALRDYDRAEEALERFEAELDTNPGATLAARNPLLLSCLVALAIEGRPLPRRRALLIGEVLELLYRTVPHDRTLKVAELNALLAHDVANHAGWLLTESPASTRDVLVRAIAEHLAREFDLNRFHAHEKAEEALTFWEERRLVERLRSGTREYLTFVHLHLGEYAAARNVVAMDDESTAEWLKRVRRLPRWRQVILFAAVLKDAERIASLLLDLDDTNDPESAEALLAAECLQAMDEIPAYALVERTMDALAARMASAQVLEAGRALMELAPLAPAHASRIALPYLDHASPEARLAAATVVLSGDPEQIPSELPQQWLEEYLPIGSLWLHGDPPPRTSTLPEEARPLQQRTAVLAVDALFRTTAREVAMAVAEKFVATQAHTTLLHELEEPLTRHEAYSVIEPFVRKRKHLYESILPRFDSPDRRDEFVALLDAIASSVGAPDPNEDASRHTFPLVSRIFGGLEIWHFDLGGLHERKDQESLELVVDRALRGMRIDREALRRELASAYHAAATLTPRGIFAHVRKVAVSVNWQAAAAEPVDAEQLRRAAVHPSSIVRNAALALVRNGAAAGEEPKVLAGALADAGYRAAFELVQFVPQIVGLETAATMMRDRLRNGSQRPWRLRGLFGGLAEVAPALRGALQAEILAALHTPNSMVAIAAADAMAKLEHECSADFADRLREAIRFWESHPLWCEQCEMDVADRTCPRCKRRLESPLPILRRELDRCTTSPSP